MKKQERNQKALRVGAWITAAALAVTSIPVFYAPLQAEAATLQEKYELLDDVQDSAILHCWNWSYQTIEDNMELIAECGYSALQTSPCTQPKDYTYDGVVGTDVGTPGVGGSGNWWKLYQPVTFSVCDNGETWLGTKEELESMCAKAEEYGIKVIVDVVANHMGNITGWKNSLDDVSPQVGEYWNEDMLTDESYWHINDYQIWMSDSRLHFTQGTMGMPDLNTGDKRVQTYVANYLDELIDCGVDGFRFDAAKHIETPDDDPSFASDFWPTVLGEAESHYKSVTGGDLYVYGEVLNTVGDNFSIDSYTKYMSVTDNSAGNHLLEAFRNNNVGTLSMDYAAEVSVLWAESHDTFMNESSRYASDKSIVRTWAMVANKDNASSLFFVRPYYSSEILENDQDGSFKSNLEATLEQAQMGECETYVWASNEVAAINHFNNRMKNYSDEMGADGNIAYCKRGNGIVLASFNGAGSISISSHGLADGTYTDEVSGNTFTVSGGTLSGTITSEYGIAVIYQNVMPNPSKNYPVQISNNKADGTTYYTDTLKVTLSESYATTASYEASTGESGTFSGTTIIEIGEGLEAGDTLTLTVTATNSRGTLTKTYTYYKDEYDLTDCIFFENTSDWNQVTAYLWNDEGSTAVINASWPGESMYECDEENNIYALKIDTTAEYNKVIFSNNGASQTADIEMGEIGYLYHPSTGTWTEYVEDSVKTPTITASTGSTKFTESITVTYTVKNATSATISVNGVEETFEDSITKTFTEDSVVTINATNESKSASKEYTYTKVEPAETSTIYLNVSACSWFESDSAVPAIKTDVDDSYTEMTSFENEDGEKIYTAEISTEATTASIVRMLPSGKYYNEIVITVNSGSDYFVGNSSWSQVTEGVYSGSVDDGDDEGDGEDAGDDDDEEEAELITVYFTNNGNWSNVYAYTWGGSENSSTWPGDAMTYVGINEYNQSVYKVTIASDCKGLIFNDGGSSKTVDITSGFYDGIGYYLTSSGSQASVGTYVYGE
ncbi:MAG: starch-binding protein [Roseburia sp.]